MKRMLVVVLCCFLVSCANKDIIKLDNKTIYSFYNDHFFSYNSRNERNISMIAGIDKSYSFVVFNKYLRPKEYKLITTIIIDNWSQLEDVNGISNFVNLISFELGNTNISSIDEIAELTKLQSLALVNTNYIDFHVIDELHNISSIELTNIVLSEIPDFSSLKQLNHLALKNCMLPEQVKFLHDKLPENLTTLNISNNQLVSLDFITQLPTKITKVWASGNNITTIPNQSVLSNLAVLVLSNNPIMKEYPNTVFLREGNTDIVFIPEGYFE